MPWSGGSYTKGNAATGGWQGDASIGIGIEADRHDTQDDDFTAGINNALAKDGQNTPTANLPMGSYKHTGVGNATNNDEYVALGQLDSISVALDGGNTPTADLPMGGFKHTGVDDATAADEYLSYGQLLGASSAVLTGGTLPNYTATLTPAPTAYTQGMSFAIIIHSTLPSSGGATLNVNGLGAKNLKVTTNGSSRRDPVAGELSARQVYFVTYEAALDSFQIANPTIGYAAFSYTPSITSNSGTATLNATGNDNWWQYVNPTLIRLHFQANINLSGATSLWVALSLPINAASHEDNAVGSGRVFAASGYSNLSAEPLIISNAVRFYRTDNTNWAIDSSFTLYGTIFYDIAV